MVRAASKKSKIGRAALVYIAVSPGHLVQLAPKRLPYRIASKSGAKAMGEDVPLKP